MNIKKLFFLILIMEIRFLEKKAEEDDTEINFDNLFDFDEIDSSNKKEDIVLNKVEEVKKMDECIKKHPKISLENTCENWSEKKFDFYEKLLIKNYVLSKGTYGYVFPALDEKTFQIIPDKVIKYLTFTDDDYSEILREIYVFSTLSKNDKQNNMVPKFYKCIYFKKKSNNIFMILMEKLEKDLSSYKILGRFAKFKESEKIKIYIKIAESLRHIHCSGFAHCDVNPSNFMFKEKGSEDIRIIDFGASTNDQFCYENNPKTSSPEENEFDDLIKKNSGYFYEKFRKERENKMKKKKKKKEDYSLMDKEIREMIEEKHFARDLFVEEIEKEEKKNNIWEIDDSLFEKAFKEDKTKNKEEYKLRIFTIKELQKQDIFALGISILTMEDVSELLNLLYPKPALLYDKLRASLRALFRVKIEIKKKNNFSDYRFYHRYYTLFANVLFGILAYDPRNRTSLLDFIKKLKILQNLAEYIENNNADLKNYYQMIFIKNLKESEFGVKIDETEVPHVIFVNKIIDSDI